MSSVHSITVIAIIAAIAVGATAILYFFPPIVTGTEEQKRDRIVGGATNNNGYKQVEVTVNGVELVADVAANDTQRTKGLAVKNHLNENESMLFVFSSARNQAFWMKDMKFPIDIIWMDPNKTVVHVEHSLEPCPTTGYCQTYSPGTDSLYVLETVEGFAVRHSVIEGTKMQFDLS
jgi:uncharacterized membrane protein (UPF0127 family)